MARARKIRRIDTVVVTGRNDRGKTGRVLRTDPSAAGVHRGTDHDQAPPAPAVDQDTKERAAGGIIEKEGPIHVSNVML